MVDLARIELASAVLQPHFIEQSRMPTTTTTGIGAHPNDWRRRLMGRRYCTDSVRGRGTLGPGASMSFGYSTPHGVTGIEGSAQWSLRRGFRN